MLDIGGVEHVAVAHGDPLHTLLVGVPPRLAEGGFNGPTVPGQSPRALCLDHQLLDALASQNVIGILDLVVDLTEGPVENPRRSPVPYSLPRLPLLGGGDLPEAIRDILLGHDGVRLVRVRPEAITSFHLTPA
jgi:hypothetical protein